MRVLLLAGTGAIGTHLVNLLSRSNNEAVVTSRKLLISREKVLYKQGNARDIKFLRALLRKNWDVIIDFLVYSTPDFKQRIDLILNATSQYIYLSSARVYADSETTITENSPRLLEVAQNKEFLSSDEYSLSKARQEDILLKSGKTNWTIIRPYITYSEKRLQLGVLEKEDWLFRALLGKTIVLPEEMMSKKTTLTYGLDVSKGIMSVINNPEALGEIYQITGKESCSWNEILAVYMDVIEKQIGRKPKVLLQNLKGFSECHPRIYQTKYDRLFNRQFDSSKIGQYVNVENFTGIREGIIYCLNQILKKPKFNAINWKAEALRDKLTQEFTPLKEIQALKQKIKYMVYRYLV